MRIILTAPSLAREFGGPGIKVHQLGEKLQALGHQVLLAGVQTVDAGAALDTVSLPPMFRFHGTPIPSSVRSLLQAVRGADVIHVMGFRDPVGTAAATAAFRAGVPYVLEPVGMHRRRLRSRRLKWGFDRTAGNR